MLHLDQALGNRLAAAREPHALFGLLHRWRELWSRRGRSNRTRRGGYRSRRGSRSQRGQRARLALFQVVDHIVLDHATMTTVALDLRDVHVILSSDAPSQRRGRTMAIDQRQLPTGRRHNLRSGLLLRGLRGTLRWRARGSTLTNHPQHIANRTDIASLF